MAANESRTTYGDRSIVLVAGIQQRDEKAGVDKDHLRL